MSDRRSQQKGHITERHTWMISSKMPIRTKQLLFVGLPQEVHSNYSHIIIHNKLFVYFFQILIFTILKRILFWRDYSQNNGKKNFPRNNNPEQYCRDYTISTTTKTHFYVEKKKKKIYSVSLCPLLYLCFI
jgi:hypothetical protein